MILRSCKFDIRFSAAELLGKLGNTSSEGMNGLLGLLKQFRRTKTNIKLIIFE